MVGKKDTKQKLLDVTRHMIDTNGVDSVSMRDLGKEMNLSRSAVYRHFTNKDELLAAITTENFGMLISRLHKLIGEIDDARKLFAEFLFTFYDFSIKNYEHYQLMFIKQWDKDQHENLHTSALELFGIIYNCMEKAHGQKHTVSKSPKQLTAMGSAFIIGLVELNSAGHLEFEKGFDDPHRLINSFIDLMFV